MNSWANIHKWVVRNCDTKFPTFDDFDYYLKKESIDTITDQGCSILHLAAVGESLLMMKFLTKRVPQSLLNQGNYIGESPLHWACRNGNLGIVQQLLNSGAALNIHDDDFNTPLHFAAEAGNYEVIKYLLDNHRMDLNFKNITGKTALHVACEEEEIEVIKLLINYCRDYEELVNYFINSNQPNVVKIIIKQRKPKTEDTGNPLHLAVLQNRYRICKILSRVESLRNGKDCNGKKPSDMLSAASDKRIHDLLRPKMIK